MLRSQDGKYLGKTEVEYFEDKVKDLLQQILVNKTLQMELFKMSETYYSLNGDPGTNRGETDNFGSLGKLIL